MNRAIYVLKLCGHSQIRAVSLRLPWQVVVFIVSNQALMVTFMGFRSLSMKDRQLRCARYDPLGVDAIEYYSSQRSHVGIKDPTLF